MNSALKHKLSYIYWKQEAEFVNLTNEEFANKIQELKSKGGKPVPNKTVRKYFLTPYNYYIDVFGNWRRIHTSEPYQDTVKFITYSSNHFDDSKNDREDTRTGGHAITLLIKKFSEFNDLPNKPMYKAFGTTGAEFKACVPKQFVWVNPRYLYRVYEHVSSIDGCSHYPSNMCGRLPNAKTMIKYEGTVEPNEEYPFAFYLKSGLMAEYGVFDGHDWLHHPLANYLFSDIRKPLSVLPDDDITVLMKASKYTMDSTWSYFYQNRKKSEACKLVMNASIGMMHQKNYSNYMYAHLAALCLSRANAKHLAMCDKIGIQYILHICVDGIIYKSPKAFGIEEKKLGVYNQEFQDCTFGMRGANCYIVQKNGVNVKVKHGAFNRKEDGTEIIESEATYDDMMGWKKVDFIEEMEKQNDNNDN